MSGLRKNVKNLFPTILVLLDLVAPTAVQAQFTYSTNAGGSSITIIGYTGPGGAVTIPSNVTGLPVTGIGGLAFYNSTNVTGVTIPSSVTTIAGGTRESSGFIFGAAFMGCTGLTNLAILGNANIEEYAFTELALVRVYIAGGSIGEYAFQNCTNLTDVTFGNGVNSIADTAFSADPVSSLFIPGSVTEIGGAAFSCPGLTNVIFGAGVASIDDQAFDQDYELTNVLFLGNAPAVINSGDQSVFAFSPTTVYYVPGTTGWSNTFGGSTYLAGAPTLLWNPQIQASGPNFGMVSNQFGFNITGTSNDPVLLQACTNLSSPVWTPLTNVNLTNGSFYFSEPVQSNAASRFYRVCFP
jgi:hypothetical protein